jgi:hypothetical protein
VVDFVVALGVFLASDVYAYGITTTDGHSCQREDVDGAVTVLKLIGSTYCCTGGISGLRCDSCCGIVSTTTDGHCRQREDDDAAVTIVVKLSGSTPRLNKENLNK